MGWPPGFPAPPQSGPVSPGPRVCCWGWDAVCWLALSKENLTKAQTAGYTTLTGYLAPPWLIPSQSRAARVGSGSAPQDQSWASKWDQGRCEAYPEVGSFLRHFLRVHGETQPSLRSAGDDRGWARIPEPLGWAMAGPSESPDMELADRPSEVAMHSWKAPG